MASTPRKLRVPDTAASAKLVGEPFPIQTNHCRTPGCANFGLPARTARGKTGPSRDRDLRYKLNSTSKGQEVGPGRLGEARAGEFYPSLRGTEGLPIAGRVGINLEQRRCHLADGVVVSSASGA